MLYPILFIIITAVLVTVASVFKITSVTTALNCALFGLAVMLILQFKFFGLVSACFGLCLILRITIKYMDKRVYEECFDDSRCNLKYIYSLIGLPYALLFVTCVAKSTILDLTYNLPQFELAFFASFAVALTFEINYTSGALLGGTFNPLTNKKIAPNQSGAISIFSVICSLVAIFVICFAYKSFGGTMPHTITIGATAIVGYAIMVLVSAWQSKSDCVIEETENASNTNVQDNETTDDKQKTSENVSEESAKDDGQEKPKKFFDLYQLFIVANACASIIALFIGFITRIK